MPSPLEFGTPFIRWGEPDHVRDLLAPHDVTLGFERRDFGVTFPSAEAFEAFVFETSGGFARARQMLEELGSWDEAHAAFQDGIAATNEADDGSYRTTWDFLLATAAKAG